MSKYFKLWKCQPKLNQVTILIHGKIKPEMNQVFLMQIWVCYYRHVDDDKTQ